MKIAVDAMGGDFSPVEIVKGAVKAVEKGYAEIILVGDETQINKELTKYPKLPGLTIFHATEVIQMDESPAIAARKKRDSSMVVGIKLVKENVVQGFVSAGSTGAQMAASIMYLGRIKNIHRPAIVTLMPTLQGAKVLLDVGATVDSKPEDLLQFAHMGSLYAEKILSFNEPTVGLINIGTEKNKGNQLTQEAYSLLAGSTLNFFGNLETRDIPKGLVDVMVCDGFIGNAILKFAEGIASAFGQLLKDEINSNIFTKISALPLLPGLKRINNKFDYSEYGGAPLLGVNGISIICHGSSNATAICNAIKTAVQCNEVNLVGAINLVND